MPLLDRRDGRSSRITGTLVVVLVVLVVAGTAAAYANFQRKVDDATSAADAAPEPSPTPSERPTSEPSTAAPDVVSLWIGDGYTAGAGADTPQSGEACAAAKDLGWDCVLDAERGTGFLSSGQVFDTTYATLADRLGDRDRDLAPDVVVIDAGRNDLGVYSEAAIAGAMDDYVKAVRRAYPSAVLVQVVPWTLGQDEPVPELAATITQLMEEYDGYVVDPYGEGWAGAGRTDLASLRNDSGVLSQAGHDLVGQHLAASIRALDLPVTTKG